MIAIALIVPITIVGLVIACSAVNIHFDEQERLLSEKSHSREYYAIGARSAVLAGAISRDPSSSHTASLTGTGI